jgi:hypothetical protein
VSGTLLETHSGLNQPQDISGEKTVTPSDSSLHLAYEFYLKVSTDGDSSAFFGPYTLNVGCFEGVVTYSDNSEFVSSVALSVGDDPANVYTLSQP